MRVYTPLELAGRDIYIREGCYACHSQMIRTLRDEVDRYGPYSLAVESKYDHPMLWGSKRTGPDLARHRRQVLRCLARRAPAQSARRGAGVGDAALRLPDRRTARIASLPGRLRALRDVGVPYTDEMIANAARDAVGQARPDSDAASGVAERYGEATQVRAFDGDRGRRHRNGRARRLPADPRPADRSRRTRSAANGGVLSDGSRTTTLVWLFQVLRPVLPDRPVGRRCGLRVLAIAGQTLRPRGQRAFSTTRTGHVGKGARSRSPGTRPPGTSGTASPSSTPACRGRSGGPSASPTSGRSSTGS